MPDCYQVNDDQQIISAHKYIRQEVGLPETGFVFSSFNQCYKIDQVIFDLWCRLLDKTPGSVLWLLANNKEAPKALKAEALARGINSDRLVFAPMQYDKAEHLSRISLADLALDTRICGGHTTSSDMLWAGVPIVTMQGKHFASRVCSSLLNSIGLSELITKNLSEYENLALSLAHSTEQLAAIKQKLKRNRNTEALFDTVKFTRNLENGYRKAWEKFVNNDNKTEPLEGF